MIKAANTVWLCFTRFIDNNNIKEHIDIIDFVQLPGAVSLPMSGILLTGKLVYFCIINSRCTHSTQQ